MFNSFLFLFWTTASPSFANFEMRVTASPTTNFIYQLDCISDTTIWCGRPDFLALWNQEFVKSDEDRRILNDWATLRTEYRVDPQFINPKERVDSLAHKLRIAGLQAHSEADYFERLALVLNRNDQERARRVFEHFRGRFEIWWQKSVHKKIQRFAKGTRALNQQARVKRLVGQFIRFYEADIPERAILPFHLIYRPGLVNGPTAGGQVDGYSFTEFRPNDPPDGMFGVVVHEMCHYFFERGPEVKLARLQANMTQNQSLESNSAFNILNETLASVFGNGMIYRAIWSTSAWSRYFQQHNSFYNVEHIDVAAKSVLPWMDSWLKAGRTLYSDGFDSEYVQILRDKMRDQLTKPQLILNKLNLIIDPSVNDEKLISEVIEILGASSSNSTNSAWNSEKFLQPLRLSPERSALFVAHPSNLSQLDQFKLVPESVVNEIKKAARSENVVYAYKASPQKTYFILASSDPVKIRELIKVLRDQPKSFDGLLKNEANASNRRN